MAFLCARKLATGTICNTLRFERQREVASDIFHTAKDLRAFWEGGDERKSQASRSDRRGVAAHGQPAEAHKAAKRARDACREDSKARKEVRLRHSHEHATARRFAKRLHKLQLCDGAVQLQAAVTQQPPVAQCA